MLKIHSLNPGKKLVGLMLFLAVLIPAGAVLTACGGGERITFPDKNLEAAIRRALGTPPGEEITAEELAELTVLGANGRRIADLTGIEHASNLSILDLAENRISDISPLASLTKLWELDLAKNQISDISPLASLSNLNVLGLAHNQISDTSPLVENSGLGPRDNVLLEGNPLALSEGSEDRENIRQLEARGVSVQR